MLTWLKNLYSGYHTVVVDIQGVIDDLDKIKRHGFVLLNNAQDDEKKLTLLKYLNGVIDSELSARRYKQSERRIQHTFVLAVFSLIGGGVGVILLKNFLP